MIHGVLIFNNDGKPRLMQWYKQMDLKTQMDKLSTIHRLIHKRPDNACNFLEGDQPDTRIVYRHYATLYFVFIVDSAESELGILDLIQVFVEALDRCFTNVCELDLIFRPDDVTTILAEIISGGLVLEVDLDTISSGVQLGKSRSRHR
ncbi:AP complex, mu/sigma subunit [Globomyces pollinis-pini]|nr:AP complex, mu/sigma subunit [Globomyces pollinis-pini]